MAWRVARALLTLRAEVDRGWPARDRTSDGTIGDAAHASRGSDHNPWLLDSHGVGVVRALDLDADGWPIDDTFEYLRQLAAAGDRRLNPDGYLIRNRRIASSKRSGIFLRRWLWRPYLPVPGQAYNPHDKHGHVSVSTDPAGYDSVDGWLTASPPAVEVPPVVPPWPYHHTEGATMLTTQRVELARTSAGFGSLYAGWWDATAARGGDIPRAVTGCVLEGEVNPEASGFAAGVPDVVLAATVDGAGKVWVSGRAGGSSPDRIAAIVTVA